MVEESFPAARHDDPALRRAKRKILEELSKEKKHPVVAEMARELLAGRLTPLDVLTSKVYSEALLTAAEPTFAKHAALSESEQAAAAHEARAEIDRFAAEDEQAEQQPEKPRARPAPEDDEESGSIMVRASARRASDVAAGAVDWTTGSAVPRSVRDRS